MIKLPKQNIQVKTFNGIEHVITKNEPSNDCLLKIMVNVGARDEIIPTSYGLAHFIEHMLFRGTDEYSNIIELATPIYQSGGSFNAMTEHDYTIFYIYTKKDYLKDAFTILMEMIFKSIIREQDMKLEKQVVENELFLSYSHPEDDLLEIIMHPLLFKNTILHHPVIGIKSNINKFSRDMVCAFLNVFYKLSEMTLFIESSYSIKKIIKLINSIGM